MKEALGGLAKKKYTVSCEQCECNGIDLNVLHSEFERRALGQRDLVCTAVWADNMDNNLMSATHNKMD